MSIFKLIDAEKVNYSIAALCKVLEAEVKKSRVVFFPDSLKRATHTDFHHRYGVGLLLVVK